VDTDEVLNLLRDVADEVINPRFRSLADDQIAEKNPGDLVTVADREAEVLITAALNAAYPGAVVLGEEATHLDPGLPERFAAADHAFTVDPVDGTKNFVHGSPDHAVMASELRGGEVVRAWIWQPQHETAYVAERGAGAFRIGPSGRERLVRAPVGEQPRGITSRRRWIGRALGELRELELTWVCCGVDYPKVVEGEADYAVYGRGAPWDHAPGSLLLAETGGLVGTFGGEAYQPQVAVVGGLIAAGDLATYELVQRLIGDLPGV
jgi:fructose-1,6-bisphosphatase/inositol monophosphatase family enzyme